eukprot:3334205-Pyramimonas_sp.AAC.1
MNEYRRVARESKLSLAYGAAKPQASLGGDAYSFVIVECYTHQQARAELLGVVEERPVVETCTCRAPWRCQRAARCCPRPPARGWCCSAPRTPAAHTRTCPPPV